MKTWTVVLEFRKVDDLLTKQDVEERVIASLAIADMFPRATIQAFEVTPYAYGPGNEQVYLTEGLGCKK